MRDASPLEARVATLFAGALNRDVPSLDADLFDTGVLDSLAFVELLVHLEQEFGLSVGLDDLDVENFRSIAHIAAFVASRTAAADAVLARPHLVRIRAGH